jgi:acyl-CoA reductase-like NAD-dependent aldehyde dehydrogenase
MSKLWPITGKRFLTPYIHGQFVKPYLEHGRKLVNPVNKTESATVYEASPNQVEEALISAKQSFSEWQASPKFRRDRLLALANRLEEHENDMAQIESLQTGKPLSDSLYEMGDVVDTLRHFAGYCDKIYGVSQQFSNMHTYTTREALGTVSLITSFNYPLLLTCWKLAPALAAGNCAIVKPAPQTPLSSLALAELATGILPPGVFNVLPGGVQVSQALIDRTDKTSFTGSTIVGQDIMRRAANRLTPLTLECGGKNAVIVCQDSDLDKAVQDIAMGAFSNAGQNCCAISRVFVHKSIYEQFLEKISTSVRTSWKATLDSTRGEAAAAENLYGPLIDENQYTRVMNYVKAQKSLPIVTGELNPTTATNGYFVPPTIFAHVQDDDPLACEEIFGPILSILKPYDHLDEAIERVNKSPYSLASGIFTRDLKKAHQASNKIKAGVVWVNMYNIMPPSLPFGGRNMSGIGKDLGKTALDEFAFEKSVMMNI